MSHQLSQPSSQDSALKTQKIPDAQPGKMAGYHLGVTATSLLQKGLSGQMHLLAVQDMVRICEW